jgi:hypothetical protein
MKENYYAFIQVKTHIIFILIHDGARGFSISPRTKGTTL